MHKSLHELMKFNSNLLSQMESANAKREDLESKCAKLGEELQREKRVLNDLSSILNLIRIRRSRYSEAVLEVVTGAVQHGINSVLPNKRYGVKLNFTLNRGKSVLKPYLIDSKGRHVPPKTVEGDMLNQVLSFCAVVIVSLRNGCPWVFYDEAFTSANVRSLSLIRKLLEIYVSMGIKFVIVTQNPIVLYGLDRKVVDLEAGSDCVIGVTEENVEGEHVDDDTLEGLISLFDTISKGGNISGLFNDGEPESGINSSAGS